MCGRYDQWFWVKYTAINTLNYKTYDQLGATNTNNKQQNGLSSSINKKLHSDNGENYLESCFVWSTFAIMSRSKFYGSYFRSVKISI